jgi:hypothetical protein
VNFVNLLLVVLGAFAAAAAIRTLTDQSTWRASLTAVAVITGIGVLAGGVWPRARELVSQRAAYSKSTPEAHRAGVGATFGAREDVLQVADDRIPRRASVYLACPSCVGGPLQQWITFRLTPRPFRDDPDDAEWVLIYNSTAAKSGLRRTDLVDPVTVAPGYTIARMR